MSYIEKKTGKSYILTIYVKPNSHHQKIEQDGKFLAVSLKSKARRNKANKELLRLLQKKLGINANQIKFLSGLYNEDKIIQIDFMESIDENQIAKRLLE
jgi:uncharacterized protein YggU (UPF0235/DUF167 family)